jgi:hypothetical protein
VPARERNAPPQRRMRAQTAGLALHRHAVAQNLGLGGFRAINRLASSPQNFQSGRVVDPIFAMHRAPKRNAVRTQTGRRFWAGSVAERDDLGGFPRHLRFLYCQKPFLKNRINSAQILPARSVTGTPRFLGSPPASKGRETVGGLAPMSLASSRARFALRRWADASDRSGCPSAQVPVGRMVRARWGRAGRVRRSNPL